MKKYVVTFTWEEVVYVVADTPTEAKSIACRLGTDPAELELCGTRVRRAALVDRAIVLWPDEV